MKSLFTIKNSLFLTTLMACLNIAVQSSNGAVITYSGAASNNAVAFTNEVTRWRTPGQPKSFDLDLNSVYGSFGCVVWGDGANATKTTDQGIRLSAGESGADVLGWELFSQTVNPDLGIGLQNFQHASYVPIDNLDGASSIQPGLASISPGNGTVTIRFNGDVTNYAGRTLRLGIMHDFQEPTAINDNTKQFDVAQTAGTGSGFATVTTPAVNDRAPKLYFFDITSITNGDEITITGYANPSTTGAGGLASIGVLTMDLSLPPGSFPQIVAQPLGSTNVAGANYTFFTGVAGAAPLTNSWTKNGNTIAGATNTSLALVNLTTGDSGTYQLIVRNQYGSVTSSPAILLVNYLAASIGTQPVGGFRTVGDNFTLSGSVIGSPVLTYQWLKGGSAVPGATNNSLAFASLALSDSGTYNLVANNTGNSVTSSPAVLTVEPIHPIYANLRRDYVLHGLGEGASFTNANGIWSVMSDEDFDPINPSSGGVLTDQTGQGGSAIEAYGGTEPLGGLTIGNFPMVGDSQFFSAGSVPRLDAVATHPGLSTLWNGFSPMTYPNLLIKFTATTTLSNVGVGFRLRVVNNNGANDGVLYSLANNSGAVLATNLVGPGEKGFDIAAAHPLGTLSSGQSVYFTVGDNQNLSGDEAFLTLTLENLASVLAPPALSTSSVGDQLTLSWPANYNQYGLESSSSLSSPAWTVVPNQVGTSVTVTQSEPEQYFRLRYNHY